VSGWEWSATSGPDPVETESEGCADRPTTTHRRKEEAFAGKTHRAAVAVGDRPDTHCERKAGHLTLERVEIKELQRGVGSELANEVAHISGMMAMGWSGMVLASIACSRTSTG
jgi:hypothetical protein